MNNFSELELSFTKQTDNCMNYTNVVVLNFVVQLLLSLFKCCVTKTLNVKKTRRNGKTTLLHLKNATLKPQKQRTKQNFAVLLMKDKKMALSPSFNLQTNKKSTPLPTCKKHIHFKNCNQTAQTTQTQQTTNLPTSSIQTVVDIEPTSHFDTTSNASFHST